MGSYYQNETDLRAESSVILLLVLNYLRALVFLLLLENVSDAGELLLRPHVLLGNGLDAAAGKAFDATRGNYCSHHCELFVAGRQYPK